METLRKTIRLLLLVVGMVLVLAVPGFAQDGGVTIQKEAIIIHPGTKLSKSDEKALNDVLSKYSKKLYRVETYKKGKLTNAVGELKLDKTMSSEVANAKVAGLTDFTGIFFGATKNSAPRALTEDKNAKVLIEQLKPILQKYNKP